MALLSSATSAPQTFTSAAILPLAFPSYAEVTASEYRFKLCQALDQEWRSIHEAISLPTRQFLDVRRRLLQNLGEPTAKKQDVLFNMVQGWTTRLDDTGTEGPPTQPQSTEGWFCSTCSVTLTPSK